MQNSPLNPTPADFGSAATAGRNASAHGTKAPGHRWKGIVYFGGFLGLGAFAVVFLRAGWADMYRRLPSADSAPETEFLQAQNRALAMEIELASGQEPYLVVDLSVPSLTLKASGVPLRSFPVLEATGRSRRFLGILGGERRLPERVWDGSSLLPHRRLERRVILSESAVPPDKVGEVDFIPPTPEEETPTLPSFRIRFQDGLSIFILAGDGGEGGDTEVPAEVPKGSVFKKLARWFRTHSWQRDPLRIDLVLPAEEAGAFYRAFTDGTALMVVDIQS